MDGATARHRPRPPPRLHRGRLGGAPCDVRPDNLAPPLPGVASARLDTPACLLAGTPPRICAVRLASAALHAQRTARATWPRPRRAPTGRRAARPSSPPTSNAPSKNARRCVGPRRAAGLSRGWRRPWAPRPVLTWGAPCAGVAPQRRALRRAVPGAATGRLEQLPVHGQPDHARGQPERAQAMAPRVDADRLADSARVRKARLDGGHRAWGSVMLMPIAPYQPWARRTPATNRSSRPSSGYRGRWRTRSLAWPTPTFLSTCSRPTPTLPCPACKCSFSI